MAEKSNIQWTDATWNVARGCSKVSPGCKYCYMMRDGEKFGYDGTKVERTKTVFNLPLKLNTPSRIFTCSLTDFFHPEIDSFRDDAWAIIRKCPQHTFQILTKRPQRINDCLPEDWGNGYPNVQLGVSIESEEYLYRADELRDLPYLVKKYISMEPLLGPIDFKRYLFKQEYPIEVDWVIVGGESGNDKGKWLYRPCEIWWMRNIVEACHGYDIPVFVKQMGTHLSKQLNMSDRHGSNIDEFPKELQIRQFPIEEYYG